MTAYGRHKPDTTLADVLAVSGPLYRVPTRHRRFVPFAVSGFPIQVGGGRTSGRQLPRSSWSVLDSASGEWEEIARFQPSGGYGQAWAREQAERLAHARNREV